MTENETGALLQELGVNVEVEKEIELDEGAMLVVGPKTPVLPFVVAYVAKGLHVVCMGMNGKELKGWCPVPVETVRTNACFTRIERLPPELNGLSNADWAWHGRLAFDALVVPEGERETSSPALRVIRHGKGCVVLWQVPPWLIDEKAKPYLRTSKRRAYAMASRLLANLGADSHSALHERFSQAEEGEWLKSYYLDTPESGDDPYRYYRW